MLFKDEAGSQTVPTIVTLLGSKWKVLIIYRLMQRAWRFNELQSSLKGISPKVLQENLRAMEDAGLVIRTVYPGFPPRVEYSLASAGQSLQSILDQMENWEKIYNSAVEKAPANY